MVHAGLADEEERESNLKILKNDEDCGMAFM